MEWEKGFGSRRRSIGKRGFAILFMRAAGLAVAAFVIIGMISYVRSVSDDTFLEKNYLARDIGLLITTVQASPGDLIYCYRTVGRYKGMFDYEIKESTVIVSDHKPDGGQASYWYAEDKVDLISEVVVKDRLSEELVLFAVIKDESGVRIIPEKGGEDASPCQ
jgi:hypothetical protein